MEAGEEQALQAADLEAAEAMATVLRATDGVRMVSFYGRDKSKLNSQRIKVKVDAPADDDQGRAVIELTANWSAHSSFIVNATEIRGVNFTMTPLSPIQSVEIRRSGRRPAVVQVPAFSLAQLPKQYQMDPLIDDTIRARCW